MHIQIITFRLTDISPEQYAFHCAQVAAVFARLPGLIAKVWLADPRTNTFGGAYAWQDRAAMEQYRDSDIYRGLTTNPHFAGVTDRDFAVLAGPTRITAGPIADALSAA